MDGTDKPLAAAVSPTESRLLAELNQNGNSPQAQLQALSLTTSPSTSPSTLTSLLDSLILPLKDPSSAKSSHHRTLSVLSLLSLRHPQLRLKIASAVRTLLLLPSTPTRVLSDAFSLLLSISDLETSVAASISDLTDETGFLALCFRPCVAVRHWLLRNVVRFRLRPSVMLTVMLGFTKDPYPVVRRVALEGLVVLSDCVVVEDQSLIISCYFRAVELLFDAEDSVRCSAIRMMTKYGQLVASTSEDKSKRDWSDALFVQLCSVVRDMSMEVRVEAFNSLANVVMVSEEILLQTLSKKASAAIGEKSYFGQYTANSLRLPASSAAFAVVHGLEDEFHEKICLPCLAYTEHPFCGFCWRGCKLIDGSAE